MNRRIILFRTLIYLQLVFAATTSQDYDLPILPKDVETADYIFEQGFKETRNHIPRHVWIATRNASAEKPKHLEGLTRRNQKWNFHFYGNEEKDAFMTKHWKNTSLLWAYEILNPNIGCSKPEIWRLAVLYKYGGLYLDDDSTFDMELDKVIQPTDRFIGGKEPYNFDDRCYRDEYPLSNFSMNYRFGSKNRQDLIGGKFLFNWALFSAPFHPVIYRTFQHIIQLLKLEYIGNSAIKMKISDHRGKLLMCATTFPITHSIHELLLEYDGNRTVTPPDKVHQAANSTFNSLGIRIGGQYFQEYGARMKAWYSDHRHDHWVKVVKRVPYLREYAAPSMEYFENKVVQAPGYRDIFLVRNGTRHGFPNMDTFSAMNFSMDDVRLVPTAVVDQMPLGPPLPPV